MARAECTLLLFGLLLSGLAAAADAPPAQAANAAPSMELLEFLGGVGGDEQAWNIVQVAAPAAATTDHPQPSQADNGGKGHD